MPQSYQCTKKPFFSPSQRSLSCLLYAQENRSSSFLFSPSVDMDTVLMAPPLTLQQGLDFYKGYVVFFCLFVSVKEPSAKRPVCESGVT